MRFCGATRRSRRRTSTLPWHTPLSWRGREPWTCRWKPKLPENSTCKAFWLWYTNSRVKLRLDAVLPFFFLRPIFLRRDTPKRATTRTWDDSSLKLGAPAAAGAPSFFSVFSVLSALNLSFSSTFNFELSTPRIPTLDLKMKIKKPNAELVWKQLEDQLAPRLRLSVIERTVYAHLLRHSRLEGKLRLQFSLMGVGRNIRLSAGPVRKAVRRPVAQDVLRMGQRSNTRHVLEVRLPSEILAARLSRVASRAAAHEASTGARV